MKRVPNARCASNVVLVRQGQSGQDFRLCVNFTDLNPRLHTNKYPMRDCLSIVHRLAESSLFSGIDMKAGFLNVPVDDATMDLLGVVT